MISAFASAGATEGHEAAGKGGHTASPCSVQGGSPGRPDCLWPLHTPPPAGTLLAPGNVLLWNRHKDGYLSKVAVATVCCQCLCSLLVTLYQCDCCCISLNWHVLWPIGMCYGQV